MPNIKPISDLRNYAKVLNEVHEGSPVYLTKNGRGTYAIMDIRDHDEFEKIKAFIWLMNELDKGEKSLEKGDVISEKEIIHYFKDRHKDD